MVEYWFRYGVTEVSAEISEDVKVEKVSRHYSSLQHDYTVFSKIIDELVREKNIAVIFDYSSPSGIDLLKSFLAELEARGVEKEKFKILVSSWRINSKILEKETEDNLKTYKHYLVYPWSEDKVEYNGFMISRSIIDSSSRVYISSIAPHGVLGYPSMKDSLKLCGWINDSLVSDSSQWFKLIEELNIMGLCVVGDTVYSGYLYEIDDKCVREAEGKYNVKIEEEADILLVDGRGWPWDSTLESCLHIVDLVDEGVKDGGLIGLISECREGLGSYTFISSLFSKNIGEDNLGVKALTRVMNILERKKLALVSTIPRSIIEKILHSRSFDTVQDLLTYGFRMYSKQAFVRIVDGLLWLTK